MNVSAIRKELLASSNKLLNALDENALKELFVICAKISEEKAPKLIDKKFPCYGCGGSGSKVYPCGKCKGSGWAGFGNSSWMCGCKVCGGWYADYDKSDGNWKLITRGGRGRGTNTGTCNVCSGKGNIVARVPVKK